MSAPRKIWIRVTDGSLMSERPSDADEHDNIYHHDDVVRELVEVANRLVNNPGWGTARYTDDGMWADGEALRAALAKIAQEDQR